MSTFDYGNTRLRARLSRLLTKEMLEEMTRTDNIDGFLSSLIKKKANPGLILAVSAIMAGAIGNIIDSAFYGIIFSESFNQPALIFPDGGGYSSFLLGKVVDMFYFPVINTHWPEWSPIKPNESLIFFRPVFNISDSAITCGVISIVLFQKRMFRNLS